mmetsp:Transcript_56884/g.133921  ORF Transcript_56884/g.133921 Transcript_56884/m.133921 type:complete len:201 (+) Transcript_56884:518-1120(+)
MGRRLCTSPYSTEERRSHRLSSRRASTSTSVWAAPSAPLSTGPPNIPPSSTYSSKPRPIPRRHRPTTSMHSTSPSLWASPTPSGCSSRGTRIPTRKQTNNKLPSTPRRDTASTTSPVNFCSITPTPQHVMSSGRRRCIGRSGAEAETWWWRCWGPRRTRTLPTSKAQRHWIWRMDSSWRASSTSCCREVKHTTTKEEALC